MSDLRRPTRRLALLLGVAGASAAALPAQAAKGPPIGEPVEFSAGDDLSPLGAGLIWRNERGGVQGMTQVVIPSFQVEFVTHSGATSNGKGMASASVAYELLGPSAADMQAITNAIYDQFLKDLAATGLKVIPLDEAQAASPGLRRLMGMSKPAPYVRGNENRSGFFSPPGLKFYFTPNDGRAVVLGDTMTTTGSQVPEEMAMRALNAGVMGVRLVVDIAEIEARGRGVLGGRPMTARVKSHANVAILPGESQLWVLTPKAKSTYMDLGHRQRYALTRAILLPDSVLAAGEVNGGGNRRTDAMVGLIGAIGGTGMSQKTRNYAVTVDPRRWSADVTAAGVQVSRALVSQVKADL